MGAAKGGGGAVIWLLLLAAGVAVWALRTRKLQALRFGDVAAVVAGLVAVKLFSQGQLFAPGIVAAGIGWYLLKRGAAEHAMPVNEARSLLDLPQGADRDTIQAAYRRLITRVHPDSGGSAELARRVNAARDTLLSDLNRGPPRAS